MRGAGSTGGHVCMRGSYAHMHGGSRSVGDREHMGAHAQSMAGHMSGTCMGVGHTCAEVGRTGSRVHCIMGACARVFGMQQQKG